MLKKISEVKNGTGSTQMMGYDRAITMLVLTDACFR
jgi:hypothetical protein